MNNCMIARTQITPAIYVSTVAIRNDAGFFIYRTGVWSNDPRQKGFPITHCVEKTISWRFLVEPIRVHFQLSANLKKKCKGMKYE